MTDLPDYERPPVVEVAVAVQFVPLPQFGMREAVAVSRAFEGWDVVDVLPALEPMVEPPPGHVVAPELRFGLGNPPVRVILSSEGSHWVAQVQQDRVAAHERKIAERPSFGNVSPQLASVAARAARALDTPLLDEPHRPEMVEVVYENEILAGEGWRDLSEMDQVLRVFSDAAGAEPYEAFEQAQIGFAYSLIEDDRFLGRLRVIADPQADPSGSQSIHLRLISRRIVDNHDLDSVLEQCHADIVLGFTAVTTERMHEIWGRKK